MRPYIQLSFLIALSLIIARTTPAGAQVATASQPAKPIDLSYLDKPMSSVIAEVSAQAGITIVVPPSDERITLLADKPVAADEIPELLQAALWPVGYQVQRLPAPDGTRGTVLHVSKRPAKGFPADMRTRPGTPPNRVSYLDSAKDLPQREVEVIFVNLTVQQMLEHLGTRAGSEIMAERSPTHRWSIAARGTFKFDESLYLLDAILAESGLGLNAENKSGKTTISIVDAPKPATKPAQAFDFENATLETVINTLATRSGFAIINSVKDDKIRVTIHDQIDDDSAPDVGKLVAALNDILTPQGAVILETSEATKEGKRVGALAVLPLEEARKTVLDAKVPPQPPQSNSENWVGIDRGKKMEFVFVDVPIGTILTNMGERLGFCIATPSSLLPPNRITVQNRNQLDAVESVKMLQEILNPLGYEVVVKPVPKANRTLLRVMSAAEARKYQMTQGF